MARGRGFVVVGVGWTGCGVVGGAMGMRMTGVDGSLVVVVVVGGDVEVTVFDVRR